MNLKSEEKTRKLSIRSVSGIALKWIIPVLIILAAVIFAKHQIENRPEAQRKKPQRHARLVSVETVFPRDHQTTITAMGKVVPAKQVTLRPEVSGKILYISPEVIPGAIIEQESELIRIDSRNYETIVKQRESELAQAELALKLEKGNQFVAEQEFTLLDHIVEDNDRELVLREPHLQQSKTALEAANAVLAKAKLDVERCTIRSPFNAVIQEKSVDMGAQVTSSNSLLTILGTDEYWIEVLVPVNQLRWIIIPENGKQQGSSVRIYNTAAWGENTYREGTVVKLLGQLEEQGRMAQLLVSVKDPLSLEESSSEKPILLVNSYVRVEIEGNKLQNVFPVKRDCLRNGDNIWIMNEADEMEILPVQVVFRDNKMVYIEKGVNAGDRIITTNISTAVTGMALRVDDSDNQNTYAADPETN